MKVGDRVRVRCESVIFPEAEGEIIEASAIDDWFVKLDGSCVDWGFDESDLEVIPNDTIKLNESIE
ncbi:MAG: hypothetical protein NTV98_06110 [Candidatus Roizmanbacteria bacterium]|nr:hypothetical protein [Candidatus Roizmanbacteria bacterium]